MKYYSTRDGKKNAITGARAIATGIAQDGGLFVPERIPPLEILYDDFQHKSYREVTQHILNLFFDDFTGEQLKEAVRLAYDNQFETEEIVPLKSFGNSHVLELFHGPTLAFKDMALCVLPQLMKLSSEKLGNKDKIVILTATSGDTGKAALSGFKNQEGIQIIVFYPEDGVSEMQKRQMATEDGKNCFVAAVKGNFDDTQAGVKKLFTDKELHAILKENGYTFSAANSINIGRLIPQVAYYVYGYLQLVNKSEIKAGDTVNVCVPTGNFGNILAAYYAKLMGLPIGKLICASNKNNVLYDFFKTGIYNKNRPFSTTSSPSMDILVSSNLERILYVVSEGNTQLVSEWMTELGEKGEYQVEGEILGKLKDFYPAYVNDDQVNDTISQALDTYNYLLDPHTAVAVHALHQYKENTQDNTPTLVVATASPFKFSESVCEALGLDTTDKDFYQNSVQLANYVGVELPNSLKELKKAPVRFQEVFAKEEMAQVVKEFLKIQ